jgi:hypothetical protein
MEDNIMSRHLTLSAKLVLGVAIALNIATASLAAGLAAMSGPRAPVAVSPAPRVARLNLTIVSIRSILLTELNRNAGARGKPKFYSTASEVFIVLDAGWSPTTCQLDAEGAGPLRAWAPGCAGNLSFEAVREPSDAKRVKGAMD